tara:strand:+ start:167704 stop:168879 length:1176 start_codon:yes stop_codon:yes gene_type:complete
MRILLINDYQSLGGVEVVVDRTASILRGLGHEVEVFAADQHIKRPSIFGYVSSPKAKHALTKVLDRFAPDAIHVHNLYHLCSPAILSVCDAYRAKSGSKIILSAHDHHLVCPNPGGSVWKYGQRERATMPVDGGLFSLLRNRWDHRSRVHSVMRALQWWWNYSIKRRHLIPDAVVCPSGQLAELMRERGLPHVQLIPNPLPELGTYERPEPSEQLQLVIAGRVEPEKGVAEFIEQWPSAIHATLRIVGEGSALERCKQVQAERAKADAADGLTVEFLGRRSHQETLAIIARSDVLALPSLVSEAAPLVLDEALAVGARILVADQPRLRGLVESTDLGWVYDPYIPGELSKAAEEIQARFKIGGLAITETPDYLKPREPEAFADALIMLYTA